MRTPAPTLQRDIRAKTRASNPRLIHRRTPAGRRISSVVPFHSLVPHGRPVSSRTPLFKARLPVTSETGARRARKGSDAARDARAFAAALPQHCHAERRGTSAVAPLERACRARRRTEGRTGPSGRGGDQPGVGHERLQGAGGAARHLLDGVGDLGEDAGVQALERRTKNSSVESVRCRPRPPRSSAPRG